MKTIKRVGYYLNNIVNVFLFLFFFSGIEVKRISISCFLYPLFLRCESFLRTTEYKTIKFVQKGASANSGTGRRLNFADNKRPAGEWDEKKNMCIITLANSRRFFLFFFLNAVTVIKDLANMITYRLPPILPSCILIIRQERYMNHNRPITLLFSARLCCVLVI